MQKYILLLTVLLLSEVFCLGADNWTIKNHKDWQEATATSQNFRLEKGRLPPQADSATFRSTLKRFEKKQRMKSVTFHQAPGWNTYTMIKVGTQYYIFCDYNPREKDKSMRVGRWRSDDISKRFVWDGEIGEGLHPDPTVGFAEGKFYLLVQHNKNDFISNGPWVEDIETRAGVDTNNDGEIDQWTKFTKVKESYSQKKDSFE